MPERITRWECANGHTPNEGILVGPTRDRLACPDCNTTLSEVEYVRAAEVDRYRDALQRIADREPSPDIDPEGSAFYGCREDARAALNGERKDTE